MDQTDGLCQAKPPLWIYIYSPIQAYLLFNPYTCSHWLIIFQEIHILTPLGLLLFVEIKYNNLVYQENRLVVIIAKVIRKLPIFYNFGSIMSSPEIVGQNALRRWQAQEKSSHVYEGIVRAWFSVQLQYKSYEWFDWYQNPKPTGQWPKLNNAVTMMVLNNIEQTLMSTN